MASEHSGATAAPRGRPFKRGQTANPSGYARDRVESAADIEADDMTPAILKRRYEAAVQFARDFGGGRAPRVDLKALREVRDLIAAGFVDESPMGRVTATQQAQAVAWCRAWAQLSLRSEREPALAMAILELRCGWADRRDDDEEDFDCA
jgi:hypothetical protein